MITGKHFSGPPEPRQYFIGDQQDIVLRAQCAHFLQELDGMHNHPPSALQQRLDNDRGNLFAAIRQELRETLRAFDVTRRTLQPKWTAMAIGRVHAMHRKTHGSEWLCEGRVVADGHCSGRVAVIPVL